MAALAAAEGESMLGMAASLLYTAPYKCGTIAAFPATAYHDPASRGSGQLARRARRLLWREGGEKGHGERLGNTVVQ